MRFVAALRAPVAILGSPAPRDLAEVPARTVLRFSLPAADASLPSQAPIAVRDAAARALQQFRVDPSVLDQALASVTRLDRETDVDACMWSALREAARGGLDALAQRIDSRAVFDDLVVPAPVTAQLREIASQLRHRRRVYEEWGFGRRDGRGLGIAALFAGESGTGKTLAAEAIANEARLDLYRIDLASVVSKYIGETEKNLSRVFEAAEQSGAVLLFDEADALFGKRSEVKDSHDRYANIEVAYLLQRVESYRGLAILTTNMRSALDRAFLRRIRFVVQFPFPDEEAREQIWRRQFPSSAPLDDIDFLGAVATAALGRQHPQRGVERGVSRCRTAGIDRPRRADRRGALGVRQARTQLYLGTGAVFMSAGSPRRGAPAAINVRVSRLVVDRQTLHSVDHRRLTGALPQRIADRIGGAPVVPHRSQPLLLDVIADAVDAVVGTRIPASLRRK
jgi:hypothetical protein